MSSRNRIPQALEPYLRLPPETAQILLTGTLGCSINWLTTRFVGALLAPDGSNTTRDTAAAGGGVGGFEGAGDTKETAVVLASWMRSEKFWRDEIRRTCGLDLAKNKDLQDRYTFLDQLHQPCSPTELESRIQAAVARTSQSSAGRSNRPVMLVLDNPDVLLALGLASAQDLNTTLLKLRSMVHATIVTCAADAPILAAAAAVAASPAGGEGVPTPLEAESAAFAVQQGHNAEFVVSARELETGAAKDVSGVLRVTRGGAAFAREEEEGKGGEEVKEMEALYLVQRDGNVKVFERGAATS
ncbi:hypothetical protein KC318_g2977 [Hortaea werneckii]|uniref:Elongator complex protein 6 n=1 Tax=Hortaea werneckii TaxID=91943 RepID=A0A3M7BKD8_HORWE|nr:hypothetical protein KC334_g3162 [Hortaea werneckii]KAI7019875.1 hypothetical protein KC355_g2924 [Hortaea werneckii]KAI7672242.1 hypothetical protein KC318_g2977 [Hortaea werneckii]RMY19676.1 hypothetical protein D0867_04549 [Hortaea werneckii]RMY40214.1 hypothetical protein D0866_01410 [Hortaea werneckii]